MSRKKNIFTLLGIDVKALGGAATATVSATLVDSNDLSPELVNVGYAAFGDKGECYVGVVGTSPGGTVLWYELERDDPLPQPTNIRTAFAVRSSGDGLETEDEKKTLLTDFVLRSRKNIKNAWEATTAKNTDPVVTREKNIATDIGVEESLGDRLANQFWATARRKTSSTSGGGARDGENVSSGDVGRAEELSAAAAEDKKDAEALANALTELGRLFEEVNPIGGEGDRVAAAEEQKRIRNTFARELTEIKRMINESNENDAVKRFDELKQKYLSLLDPSKIPTVYKTLESANLSHTDVLEIFKEAQNEIVEQYEEEQEELKRIRAEKEKAEEARRVLQAKEAEARRAVEEAEARRAVEEAEARRAVEEAEARRAVEEAEARRAVEEAEARTAIEKAAAERRKFDEKILEAKTLVDTLHVHFVRILVGASVLTKEAKGEIDVFKSKRAALRNLIENYPDFVDERARDTMNTFNEVDEIRCAIETISSGPNLSEDDFNRQVLQLQRDQGLDGSWSPETKKKFQECEERDDKRKHAFMLRARYLNFSKST